MLRSRFPRSVSAFFGKLILQADVISQIGVLGFDGSTKSGLQICSVISTCCAIIGGSFIVACAPAQPSRLCGVLNRVRYLL